MAMVEVPGGLAVGSRSNHGRRTTPRKLDGRLEKDERTVSKSPRMTRPRSLNHSSLGEGEERVGVRRVSEGELELELELGFSVAL